MSAFDKGFEVANPPSDGISCLDFSSQADYLAASSWDNQVYVYEVLQNGSTVPKVAYSHEAPVLCVKFSPDGTKLISGGGDKAGRLYDIQTGQSQQVAQHQDTIKSTLYVDQQNIIATASWDKTIAYWDLRSPTPIGTLNLSERIYSMDVHIGNKLLVAGTADKNVTLVDLSNPTTIYKTEKSPLKHQTRRVACFSVGKGYAISSIEGRVGIQYIENTTDSFSFKCHRDDSKNIFSVNDISFHPIFGTFATCGSDGVINIWDKDKKQRLKNYPKVDGTIVCTSFNRNGTILAYALSYDWSKGYKFASPINKIYLHAVKEDDVKPIGSSKNKILF